MKTHTEIRLAIYFSPPSGSALAAAAAAWLGRGVPDGARRLPSAAAGIAETRLEEILRAPSHYGFHGTIKPPFRLRPRVSVEEVGERLKRFAAGHQAFPLPPLELSYMHDFFCLRPATFCLRLQALAAETVRHFDDFRRAAAPEELARRRQVGLSPRQENMLLSWGYPYVMDEFRFHLTLTGKVGDPREKELLRRELQARFREPMLRDIGFTGLALVRETDGQPMQRVGFYAFGRP